MCFLQKENIRANLQKGQRPSESDGPEQDCAPIKPDTCGFSAKASSLSNEPNQDHLAEKNPPNKLRSVLTAREDFCPSASSVKRTFSDVERSPESLEIQAKKSNAHYTRCYEIPEETARFHTGLTGTFSTVQMGDFMASTEGIGFAEDRLPKRSSPIAVAKSLFCELEEPTEDVFADGAKDLSRSSFTSPLAGNSDVCRSLSLDSDGSMHEMSLTIDSHASHKPNKSSEERNLVSSEEQEGVKESPSAESHPKTPPAVAATQTPKLASFGQRRDSHSPFLNRLPDVACGFAQSPSFLKPRNVVAFRSYCSSINRSSMSGVSRLSMGSVEAMDVSTASSYNSASGNATPVQRRPNTNSSGSQVITQGHISNLTLRKLIRSVLSSRTPLLN